jgi:hypothetical protein
VLFILTKGNFVSKRKENVLGFMEEISKKEMENGTQKR